ncbi:YveK family protein [Paenibacillus protaetiae]|uniref:Lipopolysaccharide biosynthesis protein n=1 Tax=Paenibacillus protaetiae TaxID=2509456 RepID=A0A4P6EUX6_9BACL|nr:Wzz/FepE/Etk N-terminal domain-containing protein [Paenibacillus protaetiae]QAY66774.1 lipopolysaccharide biosynthesis protein [Paenibacillus protaetiae]
MELKQYFKIMAKKWWLIALIVFAGVTAAAIKSTVLTTPIYFANSKIIVNQSNGTNDQVTSVNVGNIQTSFYLINSYKEIIKSEAIMDKVVEKYPDLNASPGEIAAKISVTAASNSQVMNLSYQDYSYKKAADIVNAVAEVFKDQIPNIMSIDNITILTKADPEANPSPINFNPIMNIIISFIISLMIAIGIVFFIDYLDDTLKTENEVGELLQLPVLAVVGKISKDDLKASRKMVVNNNKQVGDTSYATLNQ